MSSTADAPSSMPRPGQTPGRPPSDRAGGGGGWRRSWHSGRSPGSCRDHPPRARAEVQPLDGGRSAVQSSAYAGSRLQGTAAELALTGTVALSTASSLRHRVITKDGDELPYEMARARAGRPPHARVALEGSAHLPRRSRRPQYRMLLHQLRRAATDKLAFVKPAGASWPLPLYDLALLTAARLRRAQPHRGRAEPDHPRGGAARDLRQAGKRRDPPALGRVAG